MQHNLFTLESLMRRRRRGDIQPHEYRRRQRRLLHIYTYGEPNIVNGIKRTVQLVCSARISA